MVFAGGEATCPQRTAVRIAPAQTVPQLFRMTRTAYKIHGRGSAGDWAATVKEAISLELDMRAELHVAWARSRTELEVLNEATRAGIDLCVGQSQVGAIEGVKYLPAELKRCALTNPESLGK